MQIKLLLLLALAKQLCFCALLHGQDTNWLPPSGDWHDPANWDNGVPNLMNRATINRGAASVDSPAIARFLEIGLHGTGRVSGTANLDAYGTIKIGPPEGRRHESNPNSVGSLSLRGADFNVHADPGNPVVPWGTLGVGTGGNTFSSAPTVGTGSLEVIDGDVSVHVNMSVSLLTASSSTVSSRGTFHLLRGNLALGGRLWVGGALGPGAGTARANGEVLVEHGDIVSMRIDSSVSSAIFVGTFGGGGGFKGHGQGMLTLIDGRIFAEEIRVGFTGGNSLSQGSSNGRLTVREGQAEFFEMFVGTTFGDGGPTEGLVELLSSPAAGGELTLGEDGKIVFGISGRDSADYGHIALTAAAILDGEVEARFTDGFQPSFGDSFDLITAGAIDDNYSFTVTGLSPQNQQYLRIVRNNSLLRISFVPEAGSLAMAVVACMALPTMRREARLSSRLIHNCAHDWVRAHRPS